MPRVLVTSFQPFGGHALNSSQEVGRRLAEDPPPGVGLDWLSLPVVLGECVERAWGHVTEHRPALVLALGQAGNTPRLRLEDRAVNLEHFAFADNAGNLRLKQPVVPGGPALYRTTVAIEGLFARLARAGVPVEHSFSAGTYICNHYYYHLLHRTSQAGLANQILFVHLPLLPEQIRPEQKMPSRPLEDQVACVREVLLACLG